MAKGKRGGSKTIMKMTLDSVLFGQLVRYALTGGLASGVNISVYWLLAARGMDPNLAWAIGFAAAVLVGYVVHSRWSFRGHGKRVNLRRTGGRLQSFRS
jgi:putative flippase GtrA